jgi:hypothetical protein
MQQSPLAERIQRRLDTEDIHVVVGQRQDGTILLSGRVGSEQQHARALRTAQQVAPDMRIDDGMEVERVAGEDFADNTGVNSDEPNLSQDPAVSPPPILMSDLEGFPDVPLETDESDVVDDTVYDDLPPVEPDPAYFAPTDPVTDADQQGNLQVLGGWTPTSMSSDEVDPSAEDNQLGDEAVADAIRREIQENAETTDLRVDVTVEEGVAHLRGTVPSLEDAEAAEAVAAQVPGVREVSEELDIQGSQM